MRKLDDTEDDDLHTDLTEQQERILNYIADCIASGLPPTRMEIANNFEFRSQNAAVCHLEALSRKGRVIIVPRTARGIKLA